MRSIRGILQRSQRLSRSMYTSSSRLKEGGFLSEAYQCTSAWNQRLDSPILRKIELDNFFFDIDTKYQTQKTISPIDVDLFANKVTGDSHVNELEELAHRLRKSPSTASTLPSTGHAIIRLLFELNKTDILMRILNDRVNYGVFTDCYLSSMLMDKFLSEENYRDAAKVASLHMLEEDFSSTITTLYALLSCLKYLENPTPQPWEEEPEPDPREVSKDETKIKVKFLRQPGFDFHFDLYDPHHIVGKTLAYLSLHLNEVDEVFRRSVDVLGWSLFDKWDKVDNLLKTAAQKRQPIAAEVLKKIGELVEEKLKIIEASPDKALPKPKLKRYPGMNLDKEGVEKVYNALKIPDYNPLLQSVKSTLKEDKVPKVEIALLPKTVEILKSVISKCETAEIENQVKVYQAWEQGRQDALDLQINQFKNEQKLLEIEQKKKELAEREETIFFFDNEEEWMMRQPPAVRIYRMRWQGRYKPPKVKEDDVYVPPMMN